MKKFRLILFLLLTTFLSQYEIKANHSYSMQGYFYSNLTPYGTWICLDYGIYAWRPTIIVRNWSPYRIGRWIWTDYGWYWDSYEPFGFIVYHYGRWHYDDYYGWIWIPDYQWAPAWVEWRYDDYYIGWAPLPPYAVFRVSIGIIYTHTYIIPISHWHFVKFRYFCDPYVYNYYVPEKIKYRIHSGTKFRNDYNLISGRVRNEGVSYDIVRERSGRTIEKRNLHFTDDFRELTSKKKRDRDIITTFLASNEKIERDRETLRNLEMKNTERNISLDLSKVELSERKIYESKNQRNINDNLSTILNDENQSVRQNSKDNMMKYERNKTSRNRIEVKEENDFSRNKTSINRIEVKEENDISQRREQLNNETREFNSQKRNSNKDEMIFRNNESYYRKNKNQDNNRNEILRKERDNSNNFYTPNIEQKRNYNEYYERKIKREVTRDENLGNIFQRKNDEQEKIRNNHNIFERKERETNYNFYQLNNDKNSNNLRPQERKIENDRIRFENRENIFQNRNNERERVQIRINETAFDENEKTW